MFSAGSGIDGGLVRWEYEFAQRAERSAVSGISGTVNAAEDDSGELGPILLGIGVGIVTTIATGGNFVAGIGAGTAATMATSCAGDDPAPPPPAPPVMTPEQVRETGQRLTDLESGVQRLSTDAAKPREPATPPALTPQPQIDYDTNDAYWPNADGTRIVPQYQNFSEGTWIFGSNVVLYDPEVETNWRTWHVYDPQNSNWTGARNIFHEVACYEPEDPWNRVNPAVDYWAMPYTHGNCLDNDDPAIMDLYSTMTYPGDPENPSIVPFETYFLDGQMNAAYSYFSHTWDLLGYYSIVADSNPDDEFNDGYDVSVQAARIRGPFLTNFETSALQACYPNNSEAAKALLKYLSTLGETPLTSGTSEELRTFDTAWTSLYEASKFDPSDCTTPLVYAGAILYMMEARLLKLVENINAAKASSGWKIKKDREGNVTIIIPNTEGGGSTTFNAVQYIEDQIGGRAKIDELIAMVDKALGLSDARCPSLGSYDAATGWGTCCPQDALTDMSCMLYELRNRMSRFGQEGADMLSPGGGGRTPSVCGNGTRERGEGCDDGNRTNGDGCNSNCGLETVCGDGDKEGSEECDDGNRTNGDGCSSSCKEEDEPPPVACTHAPTSAEQGVMQGLSGQALQDYIAQRHICI